MKIVEMTALGLVLIIMYTLPTFFNVAEAEPGKRICVSSAAGYAVKGNKSAWFKDDCENHPMDESMLSRSIDFGVGKYMTCEEYARDHLGWDKFNPCYEMNSVDSIFDGVIRPSNDSQIYRITRFTIDDAIRAPGDDCGHDNCELIPCGALHCDVNIGAARAVGLGVTAGLAIGDGVVGQIGFGGNVTYTFSNNTNLKWERGEIGGVQFDKNRRYFVFDLESLQQNVRAYTQGYAHSVEQQLVQISSLYHCAGAPPVQGRNRIYVTRAGSSHLGQLTLESSEIHRLPLLESGSLYSARYYFDTRAAEQELHKNLSLVYEHDYKRYISCGLEMVIRSPENEWRDGNTPLRFGVDVLAAR